MYDITWKFIEISVFVVGSISIVPEVSWHAWKWFDTDQFASLTIDWLAYMDNNTVLM